MGQHLTLGGERLGSGKKMKVETKSFSRSTFDQGRLFRSTMAAGTLVPFLVEYGLNGTTFDIDLECFINTHPTIGPLFGSAKVQLDIFQTPIRLYNSKLHNNALNIGRQMSTIKLPVIELTSINIGDTRLIDDIDNAQINPSSLLPYLGIRGIGINPDGVEGDTATRQFNALAILNYYDTVKNYFSNKQEDNGYVLHTPSVAIINTITALETLTPPAGTWTPISPSGGSLVELKLGTQLRIAFTGTQPLPEQVVVTLQSGITVQLTEISNNWSLLSAGVLTSTYKATQWGTQVATDWGYISNTDINTGKPSIAAFPLENIDKMREEILKADGSVPFVINTTPAIDLTPYVWLAEQPNGVPNILSSQEGLALKTYQSDIFNNWLKTENIDAITTQTGIDVSGGVLTIDQFIVSKKVWDMLNAINVSGGTYDDWQQVVYDHDSYRKCETPMYMGGLIKELVFQEVVSNSQSIEQPLGTLAGKGTLAKKHKGGHVVIRCDEPSIIMGIVSITPRIDYSQGNMWHVHLKTMDDFHKPFMDGIGFQDLITEQMAWWDTSYNGLTWDQLSAGKQPAWVNYMTAYNQTYGNFAIKSNEMFMTFNRRYEKSGSFNPYPIKDLTTYIDPSKFNYIFAQTSLDAQNYWTQISIDITSRRKMSSKIMPHI